MESLDEIKLKYLELLRLELIETEKEIIAAIDDKNKNPDSNYCYEKYRTLCRRRLSLTAEIIQVCDTTTVATVKVKKIRDIEEFNSIKEFRIWRDANPDIIIHNIYPSRTVNYQTWGTSISNDSEKGKKEYVWSETRIAVIFER